MNIIYCPKCDAQVYLFKDDKNNTIFFDIEPSVVYIPQTGELTHAHVSHQCIMKPPPKKRILMDDLLEEPFEGDDDAESE